MQMREQEIVGTNDSRGKSSFEMCMSNWKEFANENAVQCKRIADEAANLSRSKFKSDDNIKVLLMLQLEL